MSNDITEVIEVTKDTQQRMSVRICAIAVLNVDPDTQLSSIIENMECDFISHSPNVTVEKADVFHYEQLPE